MSNVDKEFISSQIKDRLKLEYYNNVFSNKKEIKPDWMVEAQKPENLVEDIFREILKGLEIPPASIVSQNRVKKYDIFKDNKYRYPDFKLIKHRSVEKNILIELEPFNSDIDIGIKQAKEWINNITIGTHNDALAINLNHFIYIHFDGKEVQTTELTLENACNKIVQVVLGKKLNIDLAEVNRITEQFYNHFSAIIHGGKYLNSEAVRITISDEDSIINNLIYDSRLEENQRIEYVYTIFNRLIFIKILMDWNLFPKNFLI